MFSRLETLDGEIVIKPHPMYYDDHGSNSIYLVWHVVIETLRQKQAERKTLSSSLHENRNLLK